MKSAVTSWNAGWVSASTSAAATLWRRNSAMRSEEHTSELQSRSDLVCRLLLEKKKNNTRRVTLYNCIPDQRNPEVTSCTVLRIKPVCSKTLSEPAKFVCSISHTVSSYLLCMWT